MADGAAVGGGGQPGAGSQLVQGHGDDDGGGGAAGVGQVPGLQEPVRGVVEGVVGALAGAAGVALPVAAGWGVARESRMVSHAAVHAAVRSPRSRAGAVGAVVQGDVAAAVPVVVIGEGAVGVEVVTDTAGQPGTCRGRVAGVGDQDGFHPSACVPASRGGAGRSCR